MIYMIMFVGVAVYEFVRWLVKTNPVKGLTHNGSAVIQCRHNEIAGNGKGGLTHEDV